MSICRTCVCSCVSLMHNSNNYLYNGYKVVPSAHRLPDGSFASNLLLERHSGSEKGNRYSSTFSTISRTKRKRSVIHASGHGNGSTPAADQSAAVRSRFAASSRWVRGKSLLDPSKRRAVKACPSHPLFSV